MVMCSDSNMKDENGIERNVLRALSRIKERRV